MKIQINSEFFRFILVGIVNTVFGTAVMFACYNCFGFSYWISSAANYVAGSILSYFLNKHFTFCCKGQTFRSMIRFAVNIAACYFSAYGIAQPVAEFLLKNASPAVRDNIAMLFGMVLFTVINFAGQRLFVFKIAGKKQKSA